MCKFTSYNKNVIKKHLNKIKKCGQNQEIITVSNDIECEMCHKKFTTKNSLLRHTKNFCKTENINIYEEVKIKKGIERIERQR